MHKYAPALLALFLAAAPAAALLPYQQTRTGIPACENPIVDGGGNGYNWCVYNCGNTCDPAVCPTSPASAQWTCIQQKTQCYNDCVDTCHYFLCEGNGPHY